MILSNLKKSPILIKNKRNTLPLRPLKKGSKMMLYNSVIESAGFTTFIHQVISYL